MTTPTYETDLSAWTQAQAEAIRANDLARLDIEHLAEEIESLGISDEHTITRQLQRLLHHVLKWQYQPTHRGRSWRRCIDQARDAMLAELSSPAPRPGLSARPTRCDDGHRPRPGPLTMFPETRPWALVQVLDEDFWPEA
jgi:hypothetical protein